MFRYILWVWTCLYLIWRFVEFLLFICWYGHYFLNIWLSYHILLDISCIGFDCLLCADLRLLIFLTRFIFRNFTRLLTWLSLFMRCDSCNIILSCSNSKNVCQIGRFFGLFIYIICSTILWINVSFLLLNRRYILFNTSLSDRRWSWPSIHRTIIWYLNLLIAIITGNLCCVFCD